MLCPSCNSRLSTALACPCGHRFSYKGGANLAAGR